MPTTAHFVVTKDQSKDRAVVGIAPIQENRKARVSELARMLGDRTAKSALAHRRIAGSRRSAQAAHGDPDLDWDHLARANQTIVIYMGLSTAGLIAQRLASAGRDPATPALIVVNASRADEARYPTTLGQLAATAEGLSGPALLIVGEAMTMAHASFETLTSSAPQDDAHGGLDPIRHPEELTKS
eukprot:gene64605-88379_t